MAYRNFRMEVDADGFAVVTFDMPDQSMNVLAGSSIAELHQIVRTLREDASLQGAVITSGKPAFCAGADLREFVQLLAELERIADRAERAQHAFAAVRTLSETLRELETCGKPVVAALNGTALGGGYELALACHHRIASRSPKAQFGLPESRVGLLPGAGGTQRLPRLIGALNALPLLLEGKSLDPAAAAKAGLVDELAAESDLLSAAKRWLRDKRRTQQPWDAKDYAIPGGGPYSDEANGQLVIGNALVTQRSHRNYEAQKAILSCVYEGLPTAIDAGLRIESRQLAKLLLGPQARNMIRTHFLSMQDLRKLARRPKGQPPSKVGKVGILGAGMMGAGIAYVSAAAGMQVVLIDRDEDAARRGKAYSEGLLDKAVQKGRETSESRNGILSRITATTSYEHLADADLVVEAVFEDRGIKAEVTQLAEAAIPTSTVLGSNTSTLPITGLAAASKRPANFIGIHFFSPVDRMPLVEIILGKETSAQTLARTMDYVQAIGKTPIIVNDKRGFYTSRCVATYGDEGLHLLQDGYLPSIIDNVGRMSGMPRGPLEITDDIAIDLVLKVREQTIKETGITQNAGDALLHQLVVQRGRLGRKNGKGFYDYPAGGRKTLWPGLAQLVRSTILEAPPAVVTEIKTRLLYRQALEAARCFEERVVTDPRDADVGAILAWGFAPHTGGPVSLIDTVGTKAFTATCEDFACRFGERWAPNDLLREMAHRTETFYQRFGARDASA